MRVTSLQWDKENLTRGEAGEMGRWQITQQLTGHCGVSFYCQLIEKSHLNARMNVSADIEEVDGKTSLEHKIKFSLGDIILGIMST